MWRARSARSQVDASSCTRAHRLGDQLLVGPSTGRRRAAVEAVGRQVVEVEPDRPGLGPPRSRSDVGASTPWTLRGPRG